MSTLDPHSDTWRVVKAWADEQLVTRRRLLETPGLPPPDTEQHRGAIQALTALLKLAAPSKFPPPGSAESADPGGY